MTREEEFLERWAIEEPMYLAWGKFVAAEICSRITDKVEASDIDLFLRLPVKPRLKTTKSLLQKAFYRKSYKDPYQEIEDKIGIRCVVLLSYDIRTIEDAIVQAPQLWRAQMARDYEQERSKKPTEFGYQSLHYVVRAKHGNTFDGVEIVEGTPCEIQVRTLLQHAYSELTHDTLYKPSVKATPEMQRAAAKSMALIEATDDYFLQVANLIATATAGAKEMEAILEKTYQEFVGNAPDEGALNSLLIDHYGQMSGDGFQGVLPEFLGSKPYIAQRIRDRSGQAIYRVSGILLVYYCVSNFPNAAMMDSPIDDDDLRLIYSDLGLSMSAGM